MPAPLAGALRAAKIVFNNLSAARCRPRTSQLTAGDFHDDTQHRARPRDAGRREGWGGPDFRTRRKPSVARYLMRKLSSFFPALAVRPGRA
jgi:hypothetical protein